MSTPRVLSFKEGFTLLEVLVALVIVATALGS
ncbi:type II secretion system protein, partial [Glaciimonas sp. CA11.2]